MIRRRQCTRWLLLAALLLAQGLAVAHAFDHPALDHADHACTVCSHGHQPDHAPVASDLYVPFIAVQMPGTLRLETNRIESRPAAYRSRAPPVFA